jgi:hypothetical protein
MQFYYWDGALTQPELSYTRITGAPQHKSSSINVYGVMSSSCQDISECLLGTHACGPATTCKNTYGSYVCMDISLLDATDAVTDVNECTSKRCANYTNHTCYNTIGSYTCTCSAGTTHTLIYNESQLITTSAASVSTRLGADGVTLSLWVRANDVTNRYKPLLECVDGSNTGSVYYSLLFNAHTGVFMYMVGDMYVQHSDATGEYVPSSWVHIAVVHDLRGIYMYRNGVDVLFSASKYGFLSSDKAVCSIGRSVHEDLGYFVGRILAVYVWARPLSITEVCVCVVCACTRCVRECAHPVFVCVWMFESVLILCLCVYGCSRVCSSCVFVCMDAYCKAFVNTRGVYACYYLSVLVCVHGCILCM